MVKSAQVPKGPPLIYQIVLSEFCAICSGACLGSIEFIIWTHVWAAFYTVLGLYLQSMASMRRQVDGYPLFSYFLSLSNHFMLPIPIVLAYMYTPSFTEWLAAPAESYGPHVFYSIAGAMIKDAWLVRPNDLSIFDLAFFIHHIAVIVGCALSLSLATGFGYAAVVGVDAELGSACYIFYVCYPSRMSAGIFIFGMLLSNVCAVGILWYFMDDKNGAATNTLYAILTMCVLTVRVSGWILVILHESSGKARTTARNVFMNEFCASMRVKTKSMLKMC